jgi:hypothetical protein
MWHAYPLADCARLEDARRNGCERARLASGYEVVGLGHARPAPDVRQRSCCQRRSSGGGGAGGGSVRLRSVRRLRDEALLAALGRARRPAEHLTPSGVRVRDQQQPTAPSTRSRCSG